MRKLFLNLPVRDLKKSMDFFAALGFTFNPQFTDDNAACMVFSDDTYAMLLQEPYFEAFTRRPVVDAHQQTEGMGTTGRCCGWIRVSFRSRNQAALAD